MPNQRNLLINKWPKLIVMVPFYVISGKQTPKGPAYHVTDKFTYNTDPKWGFGTQARNTLDTKAKYEHYFRKDIDVKFGNIAVRCK
jgi:hypothetical protein